MLYPQIICNDVSSAVSFQINLWSAPAITPVPSDESFVLESLSQLDALLETVDVEVVICAEICLFLWVVLHSPLSCPTPSIPIITGHSVVPTAQQSLQHKEQLGGYGSQSVYHRKSDNFHNQQFLLIPASFFGHLSFWHVYFCRYRKREKDEMK